MGRIIGRGHGCNVTVVGKRKRQRIFDRLHSQQLHAEQLLAAKRANGWVEGDPDWYPDPFLKGPLRWWDGTHWTATLCLDPFGPRWSDKMFPNYPVQTPRPRMR